LEWCKLFGDPRGKHHWGKVISDRTAFLNGLLSALKLTENEFEVYTREVRLYRDRFVAHLDSDEVAHIPWLGIGRRSVTYLYDYLLAYEDEGDFFHDAPGKASTFYNRFEREGRKVYAQ
jgi:hypothetical protein